MVHGSEATSLSRYDEYIGVASAVSQEWTLALVGEEWVDNRWRYVLNVPQGPPSTRNPWMALPC